MAKSKTGVHIHEVVITRGGEDGMRAEKLTIDGMAIHCHTWKMERVSVYGAVLTLVIPDVRVTMGEDVNESE